MGFSTVERRLLTAILIVDVPLLHSEVLVVIQQVFTHACIGGECIFFSGSASKRALHRRASFSRWLFLSSISGKRDHLCSGIVRADAVR